MIGFGKFKADKYYLLKNNVLRISLLLTVIFFLLMQKDFDGKMLAFFVIPILLISKATVMMTLFGGSAGLAILLSQGLHFSWEHLAYVLAAIVTTFPVTGLYHSCAHNAFKPKWLNRFLGEVTGLWHMSSIDEWATIHAFHHNHADDLELDPHPPAGMSFFKYLGTMGGTILVRFVEHYLRIHGSENRTAIKHISRSIMARQFLLSLMWFLVLEPELFVFLFAPNIVFKKLHYVWFNWATHIKDSSGFSVMNLDKGIYRIINLISLNLYYHSNHHNFPKLISPKNIGARIKAESKHAS